MARRSSPVSPGPSAANRAFQYFETPVVRAEPLTRARPEKKESARHRGRALGSGSDRHSAATALAERRLSSAHAPGPKTMTIASPPVMERFFMKWIISPWAARPSIPKLGTRWKSAPATTVKPASRKAADARLKAHQKGKAAQQFDRDHQRQEPAGEAHHLHVALRARVAGDLSEAPAMMKMRARKRAPDRREVGESVGHSVRSLDVAPVRRAVNSVCRRATLGLPRGGICRIGARRNTPGTAQVLCFLAHAGWAAPCHALQAPPIDGGRENLLEGRSRGTPPIQVGGSRSSETGRGGGQ